MMKDEQVKFKTPEEAALWALLSSLVAALPHDTAEEALREVIAFARVYRGASEALWVSRRVHEANPKDWDDREEAHLTDVTRVSLHAVANALYWHRHGRLIGGLCVVLFGSSPREVATELGESSGDDEQREALRAIRLCRRALAGKAGAR